MEKTNTVQYLHEKTTIKQTRTAHEQTLFYRNIQLRSSNYVLLLKKKTPMRYTERQLFYSGMYNYCTVGTYLTLNSTWSIL